MSDSKFRITTAWVRQLDERPWLLSSYCEFTEDSWGGVPEHFDNDVDKARNNGDEVRIVQLVVDYRLIEMQFWTPAVEAEVVTKEEEPDA